MPRNVTDESLLEYFRNFILCGDCYENASKISGTYLCNLCEKYFHKKCNNGRNRTHHAQLCNGIVNFLCESCLASFFPFYESDDIDFMCALYGEGKNLCKKCKRDCIKGINSFYCIICNTWHHFSCVKNVSNYESKMVHASATFQQL